MKRNFKISSVKFIACEIILLIFTCRQKLGNFFPLPSSFFLFLHPNFSFNLQRSSCEETLWYFHKRRFLLLWFLLKKSRDSKTRNRVRKKSQSLILSLLIPWRRSLLEYFYGRDDSFLLLLFLRILHLLLEFVSDAKRLTLWWWRWWSSLLPWLFLFFSYSPWISGCLRTKKEFCSQSLLLIFVFFSSYVLFLGQFSSPHEYLHETRESLPFSWWSWWLRCSLLCLWRREAVFLQL